MTDRADKVLLFDPKSHRVGCVLLQAAHGFGENNWLVQQFDTKAWITGEGYGDLKPFSATVEQWNFVAKKCNKFHASKA